MKRQDGRRNNELRKVRIAKDYIKFAEGSCLIEIGDTKVIATATIEESVPPFLKGKGAGWVTAEYGMIPRSCRTRVQREAAKGRPGGRTQEIQRLIGRSMRAVVDMPKLGERTIILDCDVVQADGGTRCASITGSFIAMVLSMEKLCQKGVFERVPVSDYVAAVSVGILDGRPILDLNYDEDSGASVDMNIVMTGNGRFIEIQGTAEKEPFKREDMNKLLALAKEGIEKFVEIEKRVLERYNSYITK